MTYYSNLVVLSPPNDKDDTKHDMVIISVVTSTIVNFIIMTVIVLLVMLICKWKIMKSGFNTPPELQEQERLTFQSITSKLTVTYLNNNMKLNMKY